MFGAWDLREHRIVLFSFTQMSKLNQIYAESNYIVYKKTNYFYVFFVTAMLYQFLIPVPTSRAEQIVTLSKKR